MRLISSNIWDVIGTCKMTALISAFTDEVKIWDVPWKHQRTMPPLLKMEKKSNILSNQNINLNKIVA